MFKIKVTNRQSIDGQTDTVEETAGGSFHMKNGKFYIMYKVKNESAVSSNMIIVSGECITVKRSGETDSKMVFDRNKRTRTFYRMPYGSMDIEIETEKIVNDLTEQGGRLRLVYTMIMQGRKIYNDMIIIVE